MTKIEKVRNWNWRKFFKSKYPYILLSPAIFLVVFFWLYPWGWSFVRSLYSSTLRRPDLLEYVGIANYLHVLTDQYFLGSLYRTGNVIVSSTALTVIIALALALALTNESIRFRKVFQIMCLSPGMVTPVVIGVMWKLILWTDWGVAQYLLRQVGLPKVNFLGNPNLTVPIIVSMEAWTAIPFTMIILYAALLTVPKTQEEAARIDGASAWKVLVNIKIPWIRSQLWIVIFFRVIFSLRTFEKVWALYNATSGPVGSGRVIGVRLYETFKLSHNIGQNSAFAYILLFISVVLGLSLMKIMVSRGGEET